MSASSLTVLAYHRVEPPGNSDLAYWLVEASPERFDAQMRYLAARYNVVSCGDVVRALRDGSALPPRALAITFDDGYRSFQDVALPILKRLGLPVALFVVTHYAGSPNKLFWWDELYRALTQTAHARLEVHGIGEAGTRLRVDTPAEREMAYERLVGAIERVEAGRAAEIIENIVALCGVEPCSRRYLLNWDELRALAGEGVAIGPHTRHHPILSRVTRSELRSEVAGSWADLSAQIPSALPIFCYPNGKPHAVNEATARAVRETGLLGGFTMMAGLNVIGRTDPLLLHRVGLEPGESLRRLALKLTPAGQVYRRLKRFLRK
jgi:peptidoglycan/xylan/chitin deacetylase (PgdA/CDA1 family)